MLSVFFYIKWFLSITEVFLIIICSRFNYLMLLLKEDLIYLCSQGRCGFKTWYDWTFRNEQLYSPSVGWESVGRTKGLMSLLGKHNYGQGIWKWHIELFHAGIPYPFISTALRAVRRGGESYVWALCWPYIHPPYIVVENKYTSTRTGPLVLEDLQF